MPNIYSVFPTSHLPNCIVLFYQFFLLTAELLQIKGTSDSFIGIFKDRGLSEAYSLVLSLLMHLTSSCLPTTWIFWSRLSSRRSFSLVETSSFILSNCLGTFMKDSKIFYLLLVMVWLNLKAPEVISSWRKHIHFSYVDNFT